MVCDYGAAPRQRGASKPLGSHEAEPELGSASWPGARPGAKLVHIIPAARPAVNRFFLDPFEPVQSALSRKARNR